MGPDFDRTLFGKPHDPHKSMHAALKRKFTFPPFSVLNTRDGDWQSRKRAWLRLGIDSELGRSACSIKSNDLLAKFQHGSKGTDKTYTHSSVFDPVLCELAYSWFAPPGGRILDPFAGGSVRGIVAGRLGMRYTGIELSAVQVEANRRQAEAICDDKPPQWICGDSTTELKKLRGGYDLLFTCPPYADLEVYSNDPADLSTMPYPAFVAAYRKIIRRAVRNLKDDRFAVWVVGEVRNKTAHGKPYYGFVGDTVRIFQELGLLYYNECIIITAGGSLPIRAGAHFNAARKLGRTHQTMLVFCKGCPRKATAAIVQAKQSTQETE